MRRFIINRYFTNTYNDDGDEFVEARITSCALLASIEQLEKGLWQFGLLGAGGIDESWEEVKRAARKEAVNSRKLAQMSILDCFWRGIEARKEAAREEPVVLEQPEPLQPEGPAAEAMQL